MQTRKASVFLSLALFTAIAQAQSLPPAASPAQVGFSAERLARIKQLLVADEAKNAMPGASILIVRHGKVAYFETSGVLDPKTKAPMAKDAIFRIYSMSKAITTVSAMMLYEEGKISLSDPLQRYLRSSRA